MSDISKLTALKGFIGAAQFSEDGKLVAKAGQVDDKVGLMLADLCSANMRMGAMQAHGFSTFSGMPGFEECKGFALSGSAVSLCVFENLSVLVENSECDFNEVYKTLKTIV
ncbi:MAG TPA: DUF2173 family protein [Spirochaetes bacterium]|nr:DUF2173 family protein [Spirochaetota bacterium]